MVKRKASAPQRISIEDRAQLSWNLGESSEHCAELPSAIENEIDNILDDAGTVPTCQPLTSPSVRTKSPRKKKKVPDLAPLDEALQQLIDSCDYYLTVVVPSSGSSERKQDAHVTMLGKLRFHTVMSQGSVCPKFNTECWLYVSATLDKCFLYYEWPHSDENCLECASDTLQRNGTLHVVYYLIDGEVQYRLLQALRVKRYALSMVEFDVQRGYIELNVFLMECALVTVLYPSDNLRYKARRDICVVMEHFHGIPTPDFNGVKGRQAQDVEVLYSAIKERHRRETMQDIPDVQHGALQPLLRPYQTAAVKWMLAKEEFGLCSTEQQSSADDASLLHPLYTEVKTDDGKILFYNRYNGYLILDKPCKRRPLPGGILADEMGLGKTVEVLACILNHPRPSAQLPLKDVAENEATGAPSEPKDYHRESVHAEHDEYFKNSVSQKSFFECICGSNMDDDDDGFKIRIQCCKCGLWQHAQCVKYDVEDPELDDYFCPHCWITRPPYPSRATLIVSPAAISHQWFEEVKRHVHQTSLKAFIYVGVHIEGFIQPSFLADHDIVLMSYNTLRKEVDYVDLPHSNSEQGRRFRHPKRFMAIPSPLVAVNWWRVCLDEAQMVECSVAKTAEMALRLSAVNRWCITGTPIQRSIDDLYGLLLFLGVDPYYVRSWWEDCLLKPYLMNDREPMHEVIGKVMWRTAKQDVLDQINVPPQREDIHWLSFMPVEEHFYRRQHVECSRDMVTRLRSFKDLDVKLNSLDRRTLSQVHREHTETHLLAPLLRLRQACCHPQVVRGQFMPIRKSTLTMEKLLESMIKKVKVECEESHRLLIVSLNGLAAIHIIYEEWADAAEKYRDVLRSARELKPRIKTDKLPQLHALNNLAEILEAGHEGIPRALSDDNLRQEARNLHTKYLEKCIRKVRNSQEHCAQLTKTVHEITDSFACTSPWWASLINWVAKKGRDEALVDRVKAEIQNIFSSTNCKIMNRFRNRHGLEYVLSKQLEDLHKAHTDVFTAVLALEERPSADIINAAVECHLRPTLKRPNKCTYCVVHNLFNEYESKLFSYEEDRFSEESSTAEEALLGPQRHGTWADGTAELMLKGILAFAKGQDEVQRSWIEDGQTHLKLLEALKKEFRGLRGVWMQLRDQVSAFDELNMANTRLRVRLPDEPKPDPPQLDIIEPSEVGHHRLKLASDRVIANNDVQKKLGQLFYLQNLAKSDYGKRGGSNPEPCPICQQVLGEQWSVLSCGHCFCVDCIRILMTNHNIGGRMQKIKCAICRQMTSYGEISYVTTKVEATAEEQQFNVVGSHSTKVEAVVRKLLQIRANDVLAKTLVFSTWKDVLDLLAKALAQNNITFCSLASSYRFQRNLNRFKNDVEISALLLPVHSGANGLNLIEATHVILVEPILNPASELQALGRVHRIGQSKPTVVHRFLVRRTIEERMYNVMKTHTANISSHSTEENILTVRNLLELFTSEDVN